MDLISRSDASTVFHPIEELLNLISVTVEVWTETDRIALVSTGRDVCSASTRTHELSYIGRVVSLVGENHSAAG